MEPPCLIFEDDDLLVINKPAGLNTHAPDPYAGEGIYDWLRHREPRWASLAIIHRLDKETSGLMVFGKSSVANRSLTDQFTRRTVRKTYLLLSDRPVPQREVVVRSKLVRVGERYVSRNSSSAQSAETLFKPVAADVRKMACATLNAQHNSLLTQPQVTGHNVLYAEPLTGRTHQIRVHAAERGFPILGDVLYGGTPAERVFLHSFELTIKHPRTAEPLTFRALPDFHADARWTLRAALIDAKSTNAWRLLHGAGDGCQAWYLERLGDYVLSQSETALNEVQREKLAHIMGRISARGAYHKLLTRYVRQTRPESVAASLVLGAPAPDRFGIRENGLNYELSFHEGYSAGLFLDQRDNRRRLLMGHVAAGFELYAEKRVGADAAEPAVLNTFAYTCGFSVAAAKAGARTTSLDLSKKYLDWGKRNFALNEIDPDGHDFIYGDVFDWIQRLGKKGRSYSVVLLDPPTFSQSKRSGVFRAEKDYGKLVTAALCVLQNRGVLFASSNAAGWKPQDFLASITGAIRRGGRKIVQSHYVPQPPDFPISRGEPAYLKTVWLRVG
jgi:23S rRNA (cytosine1962-C5)-methyltransferase